MRSLSHEIIDNQPDSIRHVSRSSCMRFIAPVLYPALFRLPSSRPLCPLLFHRSPATKFFGRVLRSEAIYPPAACPFRKRGKRKKDNERRAKQSANENKRKEKEHKKHKRPPANAGGLPCFNTCAYLAPDGGVFSSGSLAASDPTYLMVLRGVSIVMIASPVAVNRLMPNV